MRKPVKTTAINKNGRILHEDTLRVVIATGLLDKSKNSKTGGMVQVYILVKDQSPLKALKTGRDADICGNCAHRPKRIRQTIAARKNKAGKTLRRARSFWKVIRRCYVQVGKAPQGIWHCYNRGGYRKIEASEYGIFAGRKIRWGAYGDPAFIPQEIIDAIDSVAHTKRTGYTHQWQNEAYASLKSHVMASADSADEALEAVANGWRYFRVRHESEAPLPNEIVCPASKEFGYKTTCDKCGLCNGKVSADDTRKNIVIIDHSVIARTQPLIQISGLGMAA